MRWRRPLRHAAVTIGLLLLALPLAFAATLALQPLWRALETHSGIEAVGHSGPAAWCYLLLYLVIAILLLWLRRASSPPLR